MKCVKVVDSTHNGEQKWFEFRAVTLSIFGTKFKQSKKNKKKNIQRVCVPRGLCPSMYSNVNIKVEYEIGMIIDLYITLRSNSSKTICLQCCTQAQAQA